jgi:ribosomal protein S18 acetylase RimI-like enzyme
MSEPDERPMTATDPRIAPAESEAEIAACFPVMRELRPHLTDPAGFVAQVRRQAADGYRLLAIWSDGRVVACAGYRVSENTVRGRNLYVDDLVTASAARSSGHGDRLFDALVAAARAQGCRALVLDSGVQNGAAHRFYFRKRMTVSALHFTLPLD